LLLRKKKKASTGREKKDPLWRARDSNCNGGWGGGGGGAAMSRKLTEKRGSTLLKVNSAREGCCRSARTSRSRARWSWGTTRPEALENQIKREKKKAQTRAKSEGKTSRQRRPPNQKSCRPERKGGRHRGGSGRRSSRRPKAGKTVAGRSGAGRQGED